MGKWEKLHCAAEALLERIVFKRWVAMVLAVAMVLSCAPVGAVHVHAAEEEVESSVPQVSTQPEETTGLETTAPGTTETETTAAPATTQAPAATVPTTVASGTCGENLSWVLDKNGILTISGTGYMKDYMDYDGYRSPWYDYREQITAVVIGEGMTDIGWYAFQNCAAMTSVSIPEGITSIGTSAFSGCSALTELTLPQSLRDIEKNAFEDCVALPGIVIPDRVEAIGSAAFSGCASLAGSVTVPAEVTAIEAHTFDGCKKLTGVTLPNGLLSIGSEAFGGCTELAQINIPEGVTEIGTHAFRNCHDLTRVTIPDSVGTLGVGVFMSCKNLASVTLPARLTAIPDSMFYDCDSLKEITLPEGITAIGETAFYSSGLRYITLPAGITEIGENAFFTCESLIQVVFRGSVPTISADNFYGVTADCYYPAGNTAWTDEVRQNYGGNLNWIAYDSGMEPPAPEVTEPETTVPEESTEPEDTVPETTVAAGIVDYGTCGESLTWTLYEDGRLVISGRGAMENYDKGAAPWIKHRSEITAVVVCRGVTSIGDGAFYLCDKVTEVNLPDSLAVIGSNAFYGCAGLAGITIPGSVTLIYSSVFRDCTGLTEITIPYGVTNIGDFTFSGCTGLRKAVLPGSLTEIGGALFQHCGALASVTLPAGATSIGSYAFYGCGSLAQIDLPDSVTNIGGGAFYGCAALTQITIPDGVTVIGDSTFRGCAGLTAVSFPDGLIRIGEQAFYECGDLEQITLPENLAQIGGEAFHGCVKLEEVSFPDGMTAVGGFTGCTALKQVHIPEGVTSIGSFAGCTSLAQIKIPESVTSISDFGFSRCTALERIVLPDGITAIGQETFLECSSLKEVVIPDSVTSIGEQAFAGCENLTQIDLPAGLTEIGPMAFRSCQSLRSLRIPDGVTVIKEGAFSVCDSLTELTLPGSLTAIEQQAFAHCYGLTQVVFPEGLTTIGTEAFHQCIGLEKLFLPSTLTELGWYAFSGCEALNTVVFLGSAPTIQEPMFNGYAVTCYCPLDDPSWTQAARDAFGTYLVTWVSIVASGACGPDLRWIIDENGRLTVFGNGKISDRYAGEYTPWADHRSKVKEIVIEEGVTYIGNYAFSGCTAALTVKLPASVTAIGKYTFENCNAMSHTFFSGTQAQWDAIRIGEENHWMMRSGRHFEAKNESVAYRESCTVTHYDCSVCGYFYHKSNGGSHSYVDGICENCGVSDDWVYSISYTGKVTIKDYVGPGGSVVIPSHIEELPVTDIKGEYAGTFYDNTTITSVTIPNTITTLPASLFSGCANLYDVTIPESVTAIGNNAFRNCTRLQTIVFPDSVTDISSAVFYGCTALKNVTLPKGLTTVPDSIFHGCTKLASITLPETVTEIGYAAFWDCSSLADITLPEGVTKIHRYAFKNCTALPDINIPNGVTVIDLEAFYNCESLTAITIPGSVVSVGKDAFKSSGLIRAVICEGVTTIAEGAFAAGSLLSIILPGSVATVEKNAFSNGLSHVFYTGTPEQWETVNFSNSNTKLTEAIRHYEAGTVTIHTRCTVDGYYCDLCDAIYYYKSNGGSHSFHNGVCTDCGVSDVWKYTISADGQVTVKDYTGSGGAVEIPAAIEGLPVVILDGVFMSYSSLKKVTIPDTVKEIGSYTFYDCDSLTNIQIPASVTKIESGAFLNCDLLWHVLYAGTEAQWNSISIDQTNTKLTDAIRHYNCTGDELMVSTRENCTHIGLLDCSVCGETMWQKKDAPEHTYVGMQCTKCDGERTVNKLTISKAPSTIAYLEGQKLNTAGMVVMAEYDEPDFGYRTEEVTGYSVSGYDANKVGRQTITVTYGGKTATFTVEVKAKSLTGISISKAPTKVTYLEGQKLDTTGLVVKASYDNGTSATVTDYIVSGYSAYTFGEQTITVTYGGKTATFTVTVKAKSLVGITITQIPDRTTYLEGDSLNTAGLRVKASYDNGTSANVYDYKISGYDANKPGKQTITVTYGGKTATFMVTVNAKAAEQVLILTLPAKTIYYKGEPLDTTGMQVEVFFNNHTMAKVTDYKISGYDANKLGEQTVTVTYGGKSDAFTVEVKAIELEGIVVWSPTKTTYLEGEKLDIAGLQVTAHYNNGDVVAITDYTISGYDPGKVGTQAVTVSFGGATGIFVVTVKAKSLTGISVSKNPTKLTYVEGEKLDTTGLVIKATYNNGTSANVTDWTVSGYDANKVGKQTVTVTYGGKTATFTVTVEAAPKPTEPKPTEPKPTEPKPTEPVVPDSITSEKYPVKDGYIRKIAIGTTAGTLINRIREKLYVMVYDGKTVVKEDALVGTGMVVQLKDGDKVMDSVTVIVTGDTNGDGKITVTDMIATKSHLLGKSKFTGAAEKAADTNGDGKISITDFIQLKAHILGKSAVAPN